MTFKSPITLAKGNLPLVTDVLLDEFGNPVDLTDCTLAFVFQGATYQFSQPGIIQTPTNGSVAYQFTSGQTNVPGDYQAQWQVTLADHTSVVCYPVDGSTIPFRIAEPLPRSNPSTITLLRQMYEPVRATLGDLDPQFEMYSDDAISSVLRTCLMAGKVPGQALSLDRNGISPGIVLPSDMALLMYHAAKTFIMPNVAGSRYETRALSERFERQDHFYFELTNAIYDIENGAMFSSFQSFYSWVNSLTGLDIWSVLSDMETSAPVATVSIGRAGVQVSTG